MAALCAAVVFFALTCPTWALPQAVSPDAPLVKKVEPPSWWIGLTPELMLLISGHKLEATHVICNISAVHVSHTQSTANGDYLFVWLKIAPDARSGTAVCRITTQTGATSFELPLANRQLTLGKFQGLAPQDVLYLIMPDRFANGDSTNDEPESAQPANASKNNSAHVVTLDRSKPRAYHGGGATDLYDVDPHLGTPVDYHDLVAAAHQQKLKVFFDIVPNHVGPLHPWVMNPPLPDWFHGTAEQHLSP